MSKTQFTDLEFIEGLRHNNDAVLRALYKKYFNLVLKYVVNNSGNSEVAADVYQETIIVLYENAQKPAFTLNCQLQTYIFSIAKRLWLKQLRMNGSLSRFKEDEENEVVDVESELSDHLKKESDIEKMNVCMENLGEPCKTLLKDFYVYRLSMDEISEKFGYTNSDNAKTQKYKCLQRLKRYFFEN
ncbi:MAG: polymerase subunit sigma-70 [Bacteroidota bacterium]|jgi:RNA polymerase sigma factor (sigma-70 family)|nr:polymerase subunit sigma-70 [Bacteroidota bacterium]